MNFNMFISGLFLFLYSLLPIFYVNIPDYFSLFFITLFSLGLTLIVLAPLYKSKPKSIS